MGTCFLGLGRRARWSPLVPPRKMSSLSFSSSGCRGLEAATSRPLQPTLSPQGSFLSPESGPASGRRRSCFSESRFLCSLRSIPVCAAGESAGTRDPGPGSPFQFDPARVLAPTVSLAGATWWTRSAVLGRELRSAKSRRDPPSRSDSRSAHRYLLPSLRGGTELPEEPLGTRQKRGLTSVWCVCACVCMFWGGVGVGGPRPSPPPPTAITHSHPRPGRESCSLVVGALSPAGPREFGPERTFSGILGPRSLGAERGPRTLLSPGSGGSGFSEPPASLGVRLPLLPREAHRRSKAAFGLGPRSVNRTAPAAICSGGGDYEIFPPSSQHQPHACGAFSRVARKAGQATSGTPLRPPPGEDFIEEDSGSVPPTRRGQPPAPPSRLPASLSGRCSPAPTLIRLREAGLGLAGPGLPRTPADGVACHLQALGHTHTLRIGGPSNLRGGGAARVPGTQVPMLAT